MSRKKSQNGGLYLLKEQNLKDNRLEKLELPAKEKRFITQSSVLVKSDTGVIPSLAYEVVEISADLKPKVLDYLNRFCNINEKTIFPDLVGFIKNEANFEIRWQKLYQAFNKALFEDGDVEAIEKSINQSIEVCNNLIKDFPHFSQAHNVLGVAKASLAHLKQDNSFYLEAIKHYVKAIELKPDYIEAFYNLGTAIFELKQYQEAIKCLNKAIELKPDYIEAFFIRFFTYHQLNSKEKAKEDFTKCYLLAKLQGEGRLKDLASKISSEHFEIFQQYVADITQTNQNK